MPTDEDIGRNFTRMRGAMSQKDLAEAMRKRGFRWSQATVWAVEKGERPLRLTEADAASAVFGLHPQMLLAEEDELELVERLKEFGGLLEEIYELAYLSYNEQRRLAAYIDALPPETIEGITTEVVRRTAADVAIDAVSRGEAHYRGVLDLDPISDTPVERGANGFVQAFDERVRAISSNRDDAFSGRGGATEQD